VRADKICLFDEEYSVDGQNLTLLFRNPPDFNEARTICALYEQEPYYPKTERAA